MNLNVVAQSLASSQSIEGTGLWKLEIFSNTQADGNGETIIRRLLTLDSQKASTSLLAGGTAVFNDITAALDLTGYTCDSVPYLCVRILKGDNPSPDFVLTGNNVDCVPSQCKGMWAKKNSDTVNSVNAPVSSQLINFFPFHLIICQFAKYTTVGNCKNLSMSEYVIDTGPLHVRNYCPGSITDVAYGWARDWCARGPRFDSGGTTPFVVSVSNEK